MPVPVGLPRRTPKEGMLRTINKRHFSLHCPLSLRTDADHHRRRDLWGVCSRQCRLSVLSSIQTDEYDSAWYLFRSTQRTLRHRTFKTRICSFQSGGSEKTQDMRMINALSCNHSRLGLGIVSERSKYTSNSLLARLMFLAWHIMRCV
jgi:hypothetical protein